MSELTRYFKSSFTNLNDLLEVKTISWGKSIIYLFFLSLVLSLPIIDGIFTVSSQIGESFEAVAKKIPDFSIENGRLEARSEQGFIYQGRGFVFTFDPQGKRTIENIKTDTITGGLGIGFLPNEFVVAFPQMENSGTVQIYHRTPYTSAIFNNFNSRELRETLASIIHPNGVITFFIFVISFIRAFWAMSWTVLFLGLIGMFYNWMARNGLKLGETLKIMLFLSTAPILLSTGLSFLLSDLDTNFIITLMSVIFYSRIAMKKKVSAE